MEQVIDGIIAQMETLVATDEFQNILPVEVDVKWDDPGLVLVDEYPYIYVAPVSDTPKLETSGLRGYDVRLLDIQIGVVINAADYFDPTVSESPGSRELVQAANLIRKRLRKQSVRSLDGITGVRNIVVQSTNYVPDLRNDTFVKLAVISIIVERQYPHEE